MRAPDPVELARRATALAQQWCAGAMVTSVRRLAGGQSGLTYLARVEHAPESRIVLKVAPPGLPALRNRDLVRQARVLQELGRTGVVPVPTVLFVDGETRTGATPLFATSFCSGECIEPNIDEVLDPLPDPAMLIGRTLDAARVLARLHTVEVSAEGVAADPPIGLGEEIDRWERALRTLPEDFAPDWRSCADRLRSSVPDAVPPSLTHGDFRLGNLLCEGARVAAVIDWEIWAHSDPRLDLAWFLLNLSPQHPAAVRCFALPTIDVVVSAYERAGGPPATELPWFTALALMKATATTGLLAKHALRRGEQDGWGIRMIPALAGMVADANRILDDV